MIRDPQKMPTSVNPDEGSSMQVAGALFLGGLALSVFLRQYVLSGKETFQISMFVPISVCLSVLLIAWGAAERRKQISVNQIGANVGRIFGPPLKIVWDEIRTVRLERSSLIRTLLYMKVETVFVVSLVDGKECIFKMAYVPPSKRSFVKTLFDKYTPGSALMSQSLLENRERPESTENESNWESKQSLRGDLFRSVALGALLFVTGYISSLLILFQLVVSASGGVPSSFMRDDSLFFLPLCIGGFPQLLILIGSGRFTAFRESFFDAMKTSQQP